MERDRRIKDHKDLLVWRRAMTLVASCYRVTAGFPKSELFGLTSQIRRAAVSIPANLAEGHARSHTREFLRHVSIALGSAAELETHVEISVTLSLLSEPESTTLLSEIREIARMLNGLRGALRSRLRIHGNRSNESS